MGIEDQGQKAKVESIEGQGTESEKSSQPQEYNAVNANGSSSPVRWWYKITDPRDSGLQKLVKRLKTKRHHSKHVEEKTASPAPRVIFSIFRLIVMVVVFCLLVSSSVRLLQWAINAYTTVDNIPAYSFQDLFSHDYRNSLLRQAGDPGGVEGRVFLNQILYGAIYLLFFAIFNRFWLATGLYSTLVIVFAAATRIKVALRDEQVLPSDLTIVGGNAGQVGSFVPPSYIPMIRTAILAIVALWVICALLWWIFGSCRLVWWDANKKIWVPTRIIVAILPIIICVSFAQGFGNPGSWSWTFAQNKGDSPILYDAVPDGQQNGPLVSFLRYVSPKVMDKPQNYSQQTMESLAAKYKNIAKTINEDRKAKLTDSTVIFVLSESYSDPTRVPGISLNEDPLPFVRQTKANTTSGLMLSSGYGGGTANLEFQELTGMSTSNFSASLTSPYQQLVPRMAWAPSFNQIWNSEYAKEPGVASQAVHPNWGSMYMRNSDFKKFKFKHFYTAHGPEYIKHQDKIDRNPYISDASAYQEVLDLLNNKATYKHPQFIQLTTMQNHMGFENWYDNNQFQASSTTGQQLSDAEKTHIQTYAKGVNHTDQAVKDFLESLDKLDKPITIVWYGDHLPGIYDNEIKDAKNNLLMHETDYFIWSNASSRNAGIGLANSQNQYTSPNYFAAQAAEHMGAKVSPYLAFLTQMHHAIPAMEPAIYASTDWSSISAQDPATFLDSDGNRISSSKLSKEQKDLLADYKLIQYDITAGKHYLKDSDFMALPR